jgi:SAM-dependent methyltransferase
LTWLEPQSQELPLADWSENAPVADVPCPFGHGGVRRRIVDTIWEAEGAAEYQCAECDVVFLHPIMTIEEEREFYGAQFAKYMAARGQAGGADPASSFEKWKPEGERRRRLLEPWLRDGMRVLEFGSATGFLLDSIRPHVGDDLTGVEPGDDFREFSKTLGITAHNDKSAVAGGQYDLLLSYYVVEHMRDPVAELGGYLDLLAPGGLCAIEVPNVDDALVKYWQVDAFDRFYWQKAHYFNYSHETLAMVMKMAGFAEVETVPVQRYDISNHIHWMKEGKPGGAGAYTDLLDDAINAEYARVLREHWHCDTVMAVARKAA